MFNKINYAEQFLKNDIRNVIENGMKNSGLKYFSDDILKQIQSDIEEIFEERKEKRKKEIDFKFEIVREIIHYVGNNKLVSAKICIPSNINISSVIEAINAVKLIIGNEEVELEFLPIAEDLDELEISLHLVDENDENEYISTTVYLDEI